MVAKLPVPPDEAFKCSRAVAENQFGYGTGNLFLRVVQSSHSVLYFVYCKALRWGTENFRVHLTTCWYNQTNYWQSGLLKRSDTRITVPNTPGSIPSTDLLWTSLWSTWFVIQDSTEYGKNGTRGIHARLWVSAYRYAADMRGRTTSKSYGNEPYGLQVPYKYILREGKKLQLYPLPKIRFSKIL